MTKTEQSLKDLLIWEHKPKESLYNGRYNKTSMFLLPMININIRNAYIQRYLLNSYIDDRGIEHDYIYPIFVLFKVENFNEKPWQDLCKEFDKKVYGKVHEYDLGIKDGFNLVMMVFIVPDKWAESYYQFRMGKYSKMSKEYKIKFSQYVDNSNNKKVESIIWGAMYKSTGLKDKISKEFVLKDSLENPIDLVGYKKLRKDMDSWEELWDNCNPAEEVYRYNFKIQEKETI